MRDITDAKKGDEVIFIYRDDGTHYTGSFTIGKKYTVREDFNQAYGSIRVAEDDYGATANGHKSEFFKLVPRKTIEEIIGEM